MDPRVIPAVEFQEPAVSPEQRLWQAVIQNEWRTAFEWSDVQLRNTDRGSDPTMIRQEARRWLVADFNPWASDRRTVCDLADVDESLLRSAARKRLELAKADDVAREAEAHAKAKARIDEMFARLLDRADDLHPGRIDQQLRKLAEIETATV